MTEINQEFEIIKDHDLAHGEIIARSKIKWFNKKGYICTSQSISRSDNSISYSNGVGGEWVISLLFSPIIEEEEYDGPEKIDQLGQIGKAIRVPAGGGSDQRGRFRVDEKNKKVYLDGILMCDFSDNDGEK